MTRDSVKSGEYTPNRVQRIALAVWRRRKPLRYCCYGWTRWSDGRVEFQKKPSRPHGTWGVLCS